jgi:preprotein translocase subunit SecB
MAAPIEFVGYKIQNINYRAKAPEDVTDQSVFEPGLEFGFDDNFDNGLVKINVRLEDRDDRIIEIVVEGYFDINKDVSTDKEELQNYLALNGTTILLPYVRSIISMITSLDSPRAMVMPTLNVFDLLNSQDQ